MIYFDYNATAPLHKNVIKKIQSLKFEDFGNPSSVHKIGRNSKKIVEEVRRNILSSLKAKNYDLIFTSGATESSYVIGFQFAVFLSAVLFGLRRSIYGFIYRNLIIMPQRHYTRM